ncbi:hypothetical protein GCM10020256_04830 [Streptomyces thermocoprophilus]
MGPVVLVHGIWNAVPGLTPAQAAEAKAETAAKRLRDGLVAAGLPHVDVPRW